MHSDVLGENYHYKGFFSPEILNDLGVSNNSAFYFCGATPFMANVLEILDGFDVKNENINYEFFGLAEELSK